MPRSRKSKKPSDRTSPPPIPDRRVLEGLMAGLFGEVLGPQRRQSARRDAQGLMYGAWDSSGSRRVELARRALEIDPDCVDAYVLLAEASAGTIGEARALLAFRRGAVEEARSRLRDAVGTNRHVPAYLLGRKRLPRRLPEYIGFGDEDEAVAYAIENLGHPDHPLRLRRPVASWGRTGRSAWS